MSHALPISLFILGLFCYWFAMADRYVTFLYGHLGAIPFDDVTNSRYWMAGLVASGAVMVVADFLTLSAKICVNLRPINLAHRRCIA